MSCIVGLNDAADEKNKWVRVLKDVEEVCVRQRGQRQSSAAAVMRNRANNELGAAEASETQLLGREGVQEQQTLHKIRRIQKVARGTAESDRQAEAAMFQVKPSKLVAPTQDGVRERESEREREGEREGKRSFVLQFLSFCHQDDPLSMFEAATWAMSFPDLFPWGDGLPFLKRETSLDASELFRYLLLRERTGV